MIAGGQVSYPEAIQMAVDMLISDLFPKNEGHG